MFNGSIPGVAPPSPQRSDAEIQAEAAKLRELEQLKTEKRGFNSTNLTGSIRPAYSPYPSFIVPNNVPGSGGAARPLLQAG
jgi:hypothetical protein